MAVKLIRCVFKIHFVISVLLTLLFLPPATAAMTYYIDFNNGNDLNSGTSPSSPWKTIPGTRNIGNTGWQSSSWGGGTINSTNKVPAGTVFKLKSGTTHSSSNGGQILFNSTYYNTNYTLSNPVIIQRDTTWGSGSVTFDATGFYMTAGYMSYGGFGALHFQVGGFTIDGVSTDGIVVQNSANSGISHYSSNHTVGINVYNTKFYNNGTAVPDANAAASQGQLQLHNLSGGTIQYCNFDGNGKYLNGIFAGETTNPYVDGLTIDHCNIYNHLCGDAEAGDWGIGIKFISVSATVSNCEMYNNFKGADNGTKSNSFAPILKYINNYVHDNVESGINGNGGTAVGISSTFTLYLINNIIRDNGARGSGLYDGVMNLYIVHNVYDNNGAPGYDDCNIFITNNGSPSEGSAVRAYLYNNVFYKPGGAQNFFNGMWIRVAHGSYLASNFNLYSDYNSWVQRASESFAVFGGYSGSDESCTFTYGANGPGHSSGNYYSRYGCSATPPSNGSLGHYHQDTNSKGTGATDTTSPPFKDVANHDYTLTNHYQGTNLSGYSWYIPEMGVDRNGIARSFWDIGPYEYSNLPPILPPGNLRIIPQSKQYPLAHEALCRYSY